MSTTPQADPTYAAYQRGRRMGLATGALTLSVVAFVNLFGFEKSIPACVLALLALKGAAPAIDVVRRGRIALAIAAIHILTIGVVLFAFHDKLLQLLHLLEKLG